MDIDTIRENVHTKANRLIEECESIREVYVRLSLTQDRFKELMLVYPHPMTPYRYYAMYVDCMEEEMNKLVN